ncbi:MAG: hypothetical protein KHY46_03225 [Clostridiales bacterium]|nr:hypothetical protein [Clostridiales bacterium]
MRGAWKAGYEYILELRTEPFRLEAVGCDGGRRTLQRRSIEAEMLPSYLQRQAA